MERLQSLGQLVDRSTLQLANLSLSLSLCRCMCVSVHDYTHSFSWLVLPLETALHTLQIIVVPAQSYRPCPREN